MNLDTIKDNVQRNCHISDAAYAADYTLCIYLMKMREYYRWENDLSFSSPLANEEVGQWLREREQLWNTLESAKFENLKIDDKSHDPFDSSRLNQVLNPQGLVYSGGLGVNNKPHFFLAQFEHKETYNGFTVLFSAREYARDLTSPPAMTQGKIIYIRHESIKRMLWEKLETWNWNQPDNAMGQALSYYDFTTDLESALDTMTTNEQQTMLLHEIGEIKAGEMLGEVWEDMLMQLPHSKAELMLRAIRDHLADALSTLPALIENQNEPSLYFYFGNLSNMRKQLYPSLQQAYLDWHESGDIRPIKSLITKGEDHWSQLAEEVCQIYTQNPELFAHQVESLIENRCL